MKILKIPTERHGVILKTVTELDDTAWILSNRRFTHPVPPNKVGAPDHDTFDRLRKLRNRTDPEIANFGIWDTESFKNIAFVGYVSLAPRQYKTELAAEVGSEIVSSYRRRGYATTALQALIKYAREEKGFDTVVTETPKNNLPSQNMVQAMGFRPVEERLGKVLYVQTPGIHESESW